MFGLLKAGWTMFAPYRFWAMAIAAAGILTTVLVFYGNCRANAVALESANVTISELRLDLSAARVELDFRNERIRQMNEDRLKDLAEAEKMLQEALGVAQVLRVERDQAKKALASTRNELREAIRNDAEMATWAGSPVPDISWSLLRKAREGSNGP